jgi:hypothetical protein
MVESQWYVAREGQTYGPFTSDRISKGARDGELRPDDLVWREGMAGWMPAARVPELWQRQEPAPSPPRPVSVEPARVPRPAAFRAAVDEPELEEPVAASPAAPRSRSLILRHWRGELSLPAAYWGVGFLLTLAVVLIALGYGAATRVANLSPFAAGVANVTFLSFVCVLTVWQLVGVWRAAGNHIRGGKRKLWAVLARMAVIAGAARAVFDFTTVIGPMLSESAMLVAGHENIPAHRLRLLRNGAELELGGGMPFGTADALKTMLDAAPGVKVLHLNSVGGRVSEGFQIYEIVRDRKLATYTATDCVSACTIAFLGGSERYLSNKARLGFHSLSFGGVDQKQIPAINSDLREMLTRHGAPQWFIDKALSTSASSMWYPPTDDLITAKIVTQVVDPDKFAISGVTGWGDRDAMERGLLTNPLYAMIKESDPAGFKKLTDRFSDAMRLGKSVPEMIADVQAVFSGEVLPQYLRSAPDAAVHRYWRTQLAEMEHLNKGDAANCAAFAFPELRREGYNINKLMPQPLLADDLVALTDLIREAARAPQLQKPANVQQEFSGVVARVSKRIPRAQDILSQPDQYFNDPRTLCAAFIAFYTDILSLPPARSGPMLRSLAE